MRKTFGSAMRLHRRRAARPAHRHRAHHPIPKILDPHSPDEGAIFSAFAAVLTPRAQAFLAEWQLRRWPSSQKYGHLPSIRRSRNELTRSSMPLHSWETWLLEIPLSHPRNDLQIDAVLGYAFRTPNLLPRVKRQAIGTPDRRAKGTPLGRRTGLSR